METSTMVKCSEEGDVEVLFHPGIEFTTEHQLQEKIDQLTELNQTVAHNMRGSFGNLKLLADSLLARETNNGEVDIFESLSTAEIAKMISGVCHSMSDTLNTLMQYGAIHSRKQLPLRDCSLPELCKNVCSQLEACIYSKSALICYDLEVSDVPSYAPYLESILYNLICNALKYSSTERQPQIFISSYEDADSVTLSVKDNGIGIDLIRYKHRIFQLNQVFHEGYDSKGVGLFLVKAQVEALGGRIEVMSEPNKGCDFCITLKK